MTDKSKTEADMDKNASDPVIPDNDQTAAAKPATDNSDVAEADIVKATDALKSEDATAKAQAADESAEDEAVSDSEADSSATDDTDDAPQNAAELTDMDAPDGGAESADDADPETDQDADQGSDHDTGQDSDPDSGQDAADAYDAEASADPSDSTEAGSPEAGSPEADSPETAPEPAPEPAPQIVERVVETKRGGFVPALLGGVIAAGVGFFAGQSGMLSSIVPGNAEATNTAEAVALLQSEVKAQADRIAAAEAQAGQSAPVDLSPLLARLEALEQSGPDANLDEQLAAFGATLTALTERLDTLEKRPITEALGDDAVAAYTREMATLTSSIATLRSEVEALLAEARTFEAEARAQKDAAAAAAAGVERSNAITRLRLTAETGAPFGDETAALAALGTDLPAVVTAAAETGLPSVAELAQAFPDAARKALAAARAETSASGDGGLAAYISRQLGARSVTPREGDDADAVLSRAEAAVRSGDVAAAVDTLNALPDTAKAELNDWMDLAKSRLSVLNAIDALAQSQIAN